MGSERWGVGDPIGLGNDIGAPEVPYMNYGTVIVESDEEIRKRKEAEEKEIENQSLRYRSNKISDEAWELYKEKRYEEALIFVNRALECFEEVANTWNRKAIILEKLDRYEEALSYYDEAIKREPSETYRRNKAGSLIDYCYILKDNGKNSEGLEKIKMALELFEKIDDRKYEDEAWYLKGIFLERLNDIPSAADCYKKAIELASDDNLKWTYEKNLDNLQPFSGDVGFFCPNCGVKLHVTDNVCFNCGEPISESLKPDLENWPYSE